MDEFAILALIAVVILLAVPVCIVILFFRTGSQASRITRLEADIARQARALAAFANGQLPTQSGADIPQADIMPAKNATPPITEGPDPISTDIAADIADTEPQTSAWDRAVGAKPASGMRVTGDADPTIGATLDRMTSAPAEPDAIMRLTAWLKANWIYAISAASLGLAGIFFVQYGMERGLLPPALRVTMGILFGLGLVAAGEWLRRRHGDEGDTSTQYLPSVFSGAGIVSVFAATLAARHMYGLIGPELAFAGHLFTAALAVALGWFYGPLLAAVGLIGAAAAPFIVGGESDAAPWLYAYFALITAVGLGVDAVRRWRWVSILALCLGYGASLLMWMAGAGDLGWVVLMLVMAGLAVVIPLLSLTPRHEGPSMLQTLLRQAAGQWPTFSVKLAYGAALASCAGLLMMTDGRTDAPLLAPLALTALALAYLIWAEKAEGLADLALLPATSLLATLVLQALARGELFTAFQAQAIALRAPETGGPVEVSLLVAMALAISAAAAWRALRRNDRSHDLMFGLIAVLTAPVAVAILELLWAPAPVIGLASWATHIIGVAALMTGLATRFAAVDQGDMRRTAHAVLSSLSLIALALFLMATSTALTLALAVLLVVAAALDWRFNLREMGLFIQIGVAVLTYRLLIDPGLDWALDGPLGAVMFAFAGCIAAMVAARLLVAERVRSLTMAVLESAAAGLTAIFANVLITRWLIPEIHIGGGQINHWQATLSAMPWIVLMLTQLYRVGAGQAFRNLRFGLAGLAGAIAAYLLAIAVFPQNPLFTYSPDDLSELVQGPPVIDTLLLAYAVPGLMLLLARKWIPQLDRRVSIVFLGLGAGLLTLYAGLEIRRWFQGNWLG
ncbi:MAG: DUF2339 domain-containing protein, partial [Paracoccaceae bacterium]